MIHGETVCFVNKVSSGGRNLLHGPSVSFRFHVSKSDVADFHDFSSNRIEIERRNLFELRGILKFIELSLMKEIQ